MNIVFQEGENDSGAACLAMALGMKRASDAYPLIGYNPNEAGYITVMAELTDALHRMGKICRFVVTKEAVCADTPCPKNIVEPRIGLPKESRARDELASTLTGCAIVTVPHLDNTKTIHYVFVKRGETFDPRPAPNLRYNGTAYSLAPKSIIYVLD